MSSNIISKIAIVGATGRVGGYFARSLIKTGKHTVTALTRAESKSTPPEGSTVVQVDYDNEESLVEALKGQQVLIITLGVRSDDAIHGKIVKAGAKAGVKYIIPNLFGYDYTDIDPSNPDQYIGRAAALIDEVKTSGTDWISVICGFWYEWSLALGEQWFGFSIKERKVTFFDDGLTPINSSTWNRCGEAVAALFSLPESGASPSVADWKNKAFRFDSFVVTQRDMLDSLHRVLGTTDADWEIKYEPVRKRIAEGTEEMQKGDVRGFAKMLYGRTFIKGGLGNFELKAKANDVLGLPKDSLDEATKRAVEMVESDWNPFAA